MAKLRSVPGGWVMDEKQQPNFVVLNQAKVDGRLWYSVSCRRETSTWLRETFKDQENQQWFQNIDQRWYINHNVFDINEKIYTMLALKWA